MLLYPCSQAAKAAAEDAAKVADEPEPKGDVVIETQGALTVALDTDLDAELVREGIAREFVSRVQRFRKDANFEVVDRIHVRVHTADEALSDALTTLGDWIAGEVLATGIELTDVAGGEELDIDGRACTATITKV